MLLFQFKIVFFTLFSAAFADDALSKESESQRQQNRDTGSIYYEQRVQQPCHLSSSIYYGGQDIYSHPQGTESSTVSIFSYFLFVICHDPSQRVIHNKENDHHNN